MKPVVPLVCAALALGGCAGAIDAHLGNFYRDNGGNSASPAPVASPTGSPASCAPGVATPSATVIVDMAGGIGAGNSSAGPIAGYLDNAIPSLTQSQAVTISVGKTIQFWNIDQGSQMRSAIGIPGTVFPSTYAFNPALTSPAGTAIGAAAGWSTGLIPFNCYSTVFAVDSAGTFLFGDYYGYGVSGLRDVIVAQ